VTGKRTPADVLREARESDSLAKRSRVLAVIDEMKARDEPITFLGVARAARVSNWLVYAEGVREHVEAARKGQAGRQARSQQAGTTVSAASLATDLEITRAELRRTRDERDRLKVKVQRGLGHQVAQAGTTELAARIRDLTAKIESQDAELAQARAEITGLTTERDAALDEVAGLRAALRQMTRQQNALH
jgi:chromosome segregation ATPase